MSKVTTAAFVAIAALAITGPAQGKGVEIRSVCGATGCNQVDGAAELTDWGHERASFTRPSSYYLVHLRYSDAYWLPESGWFAVKRWVQDSCWYQDCWMRPGPRWQALLRQSTASLEPFTPQLAQVTIRGREVSDPDAYLPVLGNLRWSVLPPERLHLVRIHLRPTQPMPWLKGAAVLGYDRRHRVLVRGEGHFRVPERLAVALFDQAEWRAQTDSSALYAGIGVSALATLAVLALANRKRKETR